MKKGFLSITAFFFAILCLLSCNGRKMARLQAGGDTVHLKYAEYLTLVVFPDYQMAVIRNPWDTAQVLHAYVLVGRDTPLPDSLPQGTVVRVPLQNAVAFSSVHCGLVDELGARAAVGGVCDLRYIALPYVQEGCRTGRIADLGSSMNPDIERLVALRPDAVLLSPFENSGGYGRLDKLGIPLIECADYMETSPLGRAEWMRFYGMLFGRAAESDSLFARVEADYRRWADKASAKENKPKVFADLKSGATWYVPGGRSTVGRILSDAGADYVFGYLEQGGSVPLAFETVYGKAKDADFWLVKYGAPQDKTYRDLQGDYAPYAGFRAFRERRVYGCNTSHVPYYEETPFHPERLLEDLVGIFHPDVAGIGVERYFSKLEE